MKNYLLILVVLVLALVLVACGGASTPAPTAATSNATPTTAAGTAATTAPSGTTVQLQFWHGQSGPQEAELKALADKFNASHPGIQVTETFQGNYGDLYKKVTAAIAANSAPDLAVAYQNDVSNYIKSDAVIPLDDLMNDPQIGFSAADLKDIFPAFIDHYPQNGNKVYSIAFLRSMEVMYVNLDLLKNAGFNQAPVTYDDFMKICAAVSKPPDTYCYELNPDASRFAEWVFSRGGDLISANGKTVAFGQQPGVDSVNWLDQMFKQKYATVIAKAFQDQTDFSLGKIALTEGSTAGLPFYDKAIKDSGKNINWDIAPWPYTTPNPVVDLYGPSVTIFKTTPEKQRAAFTFLKWLMDKEPNAEWVTKTSYFPARQSTKDALADFIKANPRYGKAFDWLASGRGEPTPAAWNPVRGFLADMETAIANQKTAPADALKTAVDKSNAALAAP